MGRSFPLDLSPFAVSASLEMAKIARSWRVSPSRRYAVRYRGYGRAYEAYKRLVDDMSVSFLPEIQTLRKTLLKWKEEVLNYFSSRLTNARLEGFNCKASALKRRAYGYRNPENYRVQLLYACS
jgi:transposase